MLFPTPNLKTADKGKRKKLARVKTIVNVLYLVDATRIFFPMHMERTSLLTILRMRKLSTKTKVPLDAVPERLTEQGSSIFRPGDQSTFNQSTLFTI